ncbi:hypothetical protein M8C13_12445 [Crossiella sp. SN42]|uniref:hypothetical protein n=1 Tax=Crossiella sp. SN42 TaxID=2944808 RepID=UPI00207D56B4|nr:hypothetical protein [Crossiella sp. SN42]MCO1576561.1 hypothetical protein [Crossiella sp. SN42]
MSRGARDYQVDEAENTRYVAIFVDGERSAHAVVRATGTVEEAFTRELRWGPSDLLSRVADEPGWTAHELDVPLANRRLAELVHSVRNAEHNSGLTEFSYYAAFQGSDSICDIDQSYMLIRLLGPLREEQYDGYGTWSFTDKLDRLNSGRDWTHEAIQVSASEAAHLKSECDRELAENYAHHLLTEDGAPSAVVRVPLWPEPKFGEEAFTGDGQWRSSDLLSRLPEQVPETEWARVVEHMAALVRRRHAEFTGDYAVFRRPIDVLDLESAEEVVREPATEHRHTLRLLDYRMPDRRMAEFRARVFLRQAQRRAEPVDGHYYFAVFTTVEDVWDADAAIAVLRCPAAGTVRWERFERESAWVRASRSRWDHHLPIGRAEVERITRRLAAAEDPR